MLVITPSVNAINLKNCKGHILEIYETSEPCHAQCPESNVTGRGKFTGQGKYIILRSRVTPSGYRDNVRLSTTSLLVQGAEDSLPLASMARRASQTEGWLALSDSV